MPAAPEAIPPKPNTAAIIATTKKITVQRNIIISLCVKKIGFQLCLIRIVPNYFNKQKLLIRK